jgi:TolB protein
MHHESPDWSRQGLIAYRDRGIVWVNPLGGVYSVDTTLAGLWTLDPDTGERRRLLPAGDLPDWSADGSRIAFVMGQIYSVDRNGRDRRQVTHQGRNLLPSWKPDGQWIAYVFVAPGSVHRVWEARADGSDQRAIDVSVGGSTMPSWSPDASRIAYVGGAASAPFEIYAMDEMGSNVARITRNGASDLFPDYSPDGQWIAFQSQSERDRSLPQIWAVRADGSCARQLTARGGAHPSWSADGRKIVFTRAGWRTNSPENGVLWIVDVITLEERQLTWKWPERPPVDSNEGRLVVGVREPCR